MDVRVARKLGGCGGSQTWTGRRGRSRPNLIENTHSLLPRKPWNQRRHLAAAAAAASTTRATFSITFYEAGEQDLRGSGALAQQDQPVLVRVLGSHDGL